MRKTTLMLAVLLVAVAFLPACNDVERGRSVVEVSQVNLGAPVVLGILNAGSDKLVGTQDDFIPPGDVVVTMRNRAYNQFITAPDEAPYGQFHVTRVHVHWTAADASTPVAQLVPFDYEAGMDVTIPKDSDATFSVLLSSFYMKSQPYFSGLVDGSTPPFSAVASLTFFGHDSGSTSEVEVPASALCEFIGVVLTN